MKINDIKLESHLHMVILSTRFANSFFNAFVKKETDQLAKEKIKRILKEENSVINLRKLLLINDVLSFVISIDIMAFFSYFLFS